jgi:CRP-like cAMP-binding protein
MHDHTRQPTKNNILDALPPEDFARLAPHLDPVNLQHSQILYEMSGHIEHTYFPLNGMISLVNQTHGGGSIEVGLIGREGMAGVSAVLGVDKSPHMTMAQIPGNTLRLNAEALAAEFKRTGALQDLLLRYTHTMIFQLGMIASCNRLHHLEERLARWLLMCADRTGSEELPLTQEFISMMLGTRRAGVTEVAIALQHDGLIRYTRGHITITDREGLEDEACECYKMIRAEFNRLTT